MDGFRRHDLEEAERLSDAQLRQRWRRYYVDVLMTSSHRFDRIVGPFLGSGTLRRRLFNLVTKPVRARAALRTSARPSLKNYAAHRIEFDVSSDALHDVTILEVDGANSPAMLERLATCATEAMTPWLFIVDVSIDEADRAAAISELWRRARIGEVTFADEASLTGRLPIFKSAAVGPHTLLSYNQVGRPALIPTEELRRIGGINTDLGLAFEHDIYLRLQEAGITFTHLDVVLPAGRPLKDFNEQGLSDATSRACSEALGRRGLSGVVRATSVPSVVSWHVEPAEWPLVDIVIPTRDRLDLLTRCLDSIETVTSYGKYQVTILDNDSVDRETLDFFAACEYDVVRCPGEFNYAAIVNRGVAHTAASIVITINNDVVVLDPKWLHEMVGAAFAGNVGIVGTTQIGEGGEHEHDGIIIAPYPQHLRRGVNYLVEDESLLARRDVSAVTGAVQLIRREVWDTLGGMDPDLAVVLNDVDLCLRAHMAGYDVVMIPDVVFRHDAGSTRGRLEPLKDRNRFVQRWDIFGDFHDPYFPNSLRLVGSDVVYRPVLG